ncbi:hypothetical protein C8J57DRAFT_1533806 [Mycena rebaudengoi]|nr:hypothetical protein C8J57DRAFT_1533806 [Mycena rebaudengoi]
MSAQATYTTDVAAEVVLDNLDRGYLLDDHNFPQEEDDDWRKPFMQTVRQWRNIKMFKRFGRAHDLDGIDETADGELALLCPACPQPGINLPEGWRDEPPETVYKFAAHFGEDANFRLKERMVSSNA